MSPCRLLSVSISLFFVYPYVTTITKQEHYRLNKSHQNSVFQENAGYCYEEMFLNDKYSNAYLACLTEYALQENWYPSPLAGLYTYPAWNGFDGFWQNGAYIETMANFMHYANSTRYKNVILRSWRSLPELLHAYFPQPSFDDEAWFGLAFARVHEVMPNETFLEVAEAVYNWTWVLGWDTSNGCGGGIWFDGRLSKKITIANAQMLKLGAKLYRLGGRKDPHLLNKVNKTLQYFFRNSVINETTFLVSDEIDPTTCIPNTKYNITYNAGVLIGGLVESARIFNNNTLIEIAHRIANAMIVFSKDKQGVFTEYCGTCPYDEDAMMFKGIFARNLRLLMEVSNSTMFNYYSKWLQFNIEAVKKYDMCQLENMRLCNITYQDGPPVFNATGPVFDTSWSGPFVKTSPKQQASVLDLLISNISPELECIGYGCSFNPPLPPIQRVDCNNTHCPPKRQCCTWDKIYHTCCQADQECVSGGCY